ncbi:MAG: LysR family transcriptional regulator [Myxococcota bacterium]|nr:LysR family transcriptional regulator [Myxococcota bacterium]
MDYRTLRNIDLNLLIVLDVLLQERSVTSAAKRLGRTQSAVSHALARLRSTFDDKLLVRVGTSMVPTPRAKNLQKDLQRLLSSLRRFMDDTEQFSARETTRTFTLEIPDFLSPMLRSLLIRFEYEAPKASLLIRKVHYSLQNVEKGITLRILPMSLSIPIGLARSPIGVCHWRTFFRNGHPISEDWTPQSWTSYSHIQYLESGYKQDGLESSIEKSGIRRQVKAAVDSFAMAVSMAEQSECLFSCLCMNDEETLPRLTSRPVPFDAEPVTFGLVWSETLDQDDAKAWFEELVRVSFSSNDSQTPK